MKCFKGGELSLKITPRNGQSPIVDHDALNCQNPTTVTKIPLEGLGSLEDTVCKAL